METTKRRRVSAKERKQIHDKCNGQYLQQYSIQSLERDYKHYYYIIRGEKNMRSEREIRRVLEEITENFEKNGNREYKGNKEALE